MSTEARKRSDIARLEVLANAIFDQAETRGRAAAIDRALGELTTAAQDCWTRHRAMAFAVPNTLWACGEAAIESGWPDAAIALRCRSTEFAIIYDAVHAPAEPKFASGVLFQHTFALLAGRKEQLESASSAVLRTPDKLYRAVAELLSLMQHLEGDIKVLCLGLGGIAGDVESFIAADAVEARIAAMEVRFWVSVTLGGMSAYDHSRHDERLRSGIAEIIRIERVFGSVPAEWLRPALNTLKVALFLAGHLSALASLEMAFAGLEPLQQFTVDTSSPIARAAMRARIELRGSVRGYGQRLENVLHSLDDNEPVRYADLIADAERKSDGYR